MSMNTCYLLLRIRAIFDVVIWSEYLKVKKNNISHSRAQNKNTKLTLEKTALHSAATSSEAEEPGCHHANEGLSFRLPDCGPAS